MYKKPTQPVTNQNLRKPPSRSNETPYQSSSQQPVSQRPKYVPPISKDKKNETVTKESQFKTRDEQILNVVKEYLSSHGYTRTIDTLRREKPMTKVGVANNSIQKRKESISNTTNNAKSELEEKTLIRYFEKGQREEFFKSSLKWWNTSDHNAAKLEFELQVYFCIFNVHPTVNKSETIDKPSLEAFKKYLESRGSQLASEEQYITYFSLPYISKPHENPSFSYLFTKEYIVKLKQKLIEFIHQHFEQAQRESKMSFNNQSIEKERKCCQLEEIFDFWVESKSSFISQSDKEESDNTLKSRTKESKEIKEFKSFKESKEYQEVQDEIKKLKAKLDEANEHREYALNYVEKLSSNIKELAESSKANLLESNKKWFLFAKDIIVMVRKAMKQQGFKIEGFDKFEGFFGKNIDEVINNADVSIFDKQSMTVDDYSIVGDNRSKNITADKSALMQSQKQRNETSSQLDMVKIQSLFANAEDPEREMQILLLLKALKNRFSKLKNPFAKREVIVEYSRHDICGVTPQKYYIQKKLLVDGSLRIREFYLRLTNDIAFDLYGIHYLTKSEKLIENLMNVLKQEILEETASKKFVLAILQRFSYPIKSRKKMVELGTEIFFMKGIVPLIFKVLASEQDNPSIYTLQYLTAMIMNLSLKKDCEKHFSPFKQELLEWMIELMCHESEQIRNYVNGALYLLLSYKELLQEARRQHLEERIEEMLENTEQGEQNGTERKQDLNQSSPYSIEEEEQEAAQSSLHVQYNYILKKIRGEIEVDEEESDEEEDDEAVEIDEFEEEDENGEEEEEDEDGDESEYIDGEDEYISGEELLLKEFTLLGPEALKEQLLTRSVLDETARKINNTTLSMNRSKRLDNIFVQKEKGSQQLILQPEFDKLLGQENMTVSRENIVIKRK